MVNDSNFMSNMSSSRHMFMSAYLMDFGFGGFLGYGKGMPVRLVVYEELKRRKMVDV